MPFTFSHPAAVLIINTKLKRYFCFTGLVLGSMAPDFEYFLHLKPFSTIGHEFTGFIFLNLPLCFLIAFIFHKIFKRPLILHLPHQLSNLVSGYAQKEWNLNSLRKVAVFIYSALLGMLTHIIWDSFTHIKGKMVELIPTLSYEFHFAGYTVAFYINYYNMAVQYLVQ